MGSPTSAAAPACNKLDEHSAQIVGVQADALGALDGNCVAAVLPALLPHLWLDPGCFITFCSLRDSILGMHVHADGTLMLHAHQHCKASRCVTCWQAICSDS